MMATRHTYTWIHKYIFPGGLIPSTEAIEQPARRSTRRCGRRAARHRPALRAHAAAVARAVPRQLGRRSRARLRRDVPADVGVLPRLLRGRASAPATSTSPADASSAEGGSRTRGPAPRCPRYVSVSADGDRLDREVVQAAVVGVEDHRRDHQADQRSVRTSACSRVTRSAVHADDRHPGAELTEGAAEPARSAGSPRPGKASSVKDSPASSTPAAPTNSVGDEQAGEPVDEQRQRCRRPQPATDPGPSAGSPSRCPAYDCSPTSAPVPRAGRTLPRHRAHRGGPSAAARRRSRLGGP